MPPVENNVCVSCHTPKAKLTCASCKESLCKACAQFADQDSFSFLPKMPGGLEAGGYCIQCADLKLRPQLEAYEEKLEQARNVSVFLVNQSKEVRAYKRAENPVEVLDCEDRDEALVRLAFKAIEAGYHTLINVDFSPKKIRNGSHLKTLWSATGMPAERMVRK